MAYRLTEQMINKFIRFGIHINGIQTLSIAFVFTFS